MTADIHKNSIIFNRRNILTFSYIFIFIRTTVRQSSELRFHASHKASESYANKLFEEFTKTFFVLAQA